MADVDFQSSLGWEIILNCVCVLMFDITICFCKGSNAAAALHLSMNQACNWWQKGGSPRASKHRTVRDVNLCFLFTARLRLAKRNQLYEAWTPAGSWGERRSSLLALRTCLSEKSVQIFLDVYYIYIHHHPPFFSFSCSILVQVPQWSLASFNQSTWPGLIRASGQKLNLNSRMLMYCISIIQVTSGDILTTQVAPELTYRTDHPCILSCYLVVQGRLVCPVMSVANTCWWETWDILGPRYSKSFPLRTMQCFCCAAFKVTDGLSTFFASVNEEVGDSTHARHVAKDLGFLLSTFFIIFLPSVWSFSGSSWKQRYWNEAAATFFICFQRMLNSG